MLHDVGDDRSKICEFDETIFRYKFSDGHLIELIFFQGLLVPLFPELIIFLSACTALNVDGLVILFHDIN